MANFPLLKTGAVAQYPMERTRGFATQVFRFVDGREQRFRQFGAPLRRWSIRLSLLDEAELANLETFFVGQGGRAGTFAFTDPWDGTVYPSCSFGEDQLALAFEGETRGRTSLSVKENRS